MQEMKSVKENNAYVLDPDDRFPDACSGEPSAGSGVGLHVVVGRRPLFRLQMVNLVPSGAATGQPKCGKIVGLSFSVAGDGCRNLPESASGKTTEGRSVVLGSCECGGRN